MSHDKKTTINYDLILKISKSYKFLKTNMGIEIYVILEYEWKNDLGGSLTISPTIH